MSETLSMDQVFLKKLTEIVLANLGNQNFSVDDLAREAGMSRITIHRKIKSIKNQDISQFIKEIRLRRAKELLTQNVGTASEISYMVGFGSPAYFNKCFHEFYGYPPGKLKKSKSEKDENNVNDTPGLKILNSKSWKHSYVLVAIIFLLIVIFWLIGYNTRGSHNKNIFIDRDIPPEISIAVLPFVNLNPGDSGRYFTDGLMEEILGNLCKIRDLRVLSKTSTEQFRKTSKSLSEISSTLGVKYLVEGSGQKLDNKLVLWVGLMDAAGEKELWTKSYSREIFKTTDIVALQSEIAQKIAAELKAVITPDEKQLIEKKSTINLTALDFYQRGREELGKFRFHDLIVTSTTYPIFFDYPLNKKAIDKAKIFFKTALAYDSTFAPAYAELAAINWSENYFREYFSSSYLDSVLILAKKALSFDDQLADGYYMRAMYYGETGNIEQARRDFDKTLQLDPNHWQAYYGKGSLFLEEYPDADYTIALDNFLKAASRYHGSALPYLLERIGYVLNITGFSDLAYKYNLKASQLELDSAKYFLSLASLLTWSGGGDTIKARHYLEQAYAKDSTDIGMLRSRIVYFWVKGDYSNSLRIYRKYRELLKDNRITMVNELHRWAPLYSALGMTDSADYLYNKQIEYCNEAIKLGRPYGRSFAYYDLAVISADKGNIKKALEYLDIFKNRKGMCAWFPINGPGARRFENYPEFHKINKLMNAGYLEEHERVKKWLEEQGML